MADWFRTNVIVKPRKNNAEGFDFFKEVYCSFDVNIDYMGPRAWFDMDGIENKPDASFIHFAIINAYSPEGAVYFCHCIAEKYSVDVYAVYSHETDIQRTDFWQGKSIGQYIITEYGTVFKAPEKNDQITLNEFFNMAWEGNRSPDGYEENFFNQHDAKLYSITQPSLESWFNEGGIKEKDWADSEEINERKKMDCKWFKGQKAHTEQFFVPYVHGEDKTCVLEIRNINFYSDILIHDEGAEYNVYNNMSVEHPKVCYSAEEKSIILFEVIPESLKKEFMKLMDEDDFFDKNDKYFFGHIFTEIGNGHTYLLDKNNVPVKCLAEGDHFEKGTGLFLIDEEDYDYENEKLKEGILGKYPEIKCMID